MRHAMAADVRRNFARYDFENYTHVIEKVKRAWLKEFEIVTRFDDGDVLVSCEVEVYDDIGMEVVQEMYRVSAGLERVEVWRV